MPVPAMEEPVLDHHKRFQAAVDVIHNLPKNGSYSPSYEVMLRFYSLYKQAVVGPCTAGRPGFWDPVGRYKWDAWSRLGEMSSESAMAAYVDEMKKVAQEVIDSMPMNEKTASLLHHFEPLYLVIEDMPRPPGSLLALREGLKGSEPADGPAERKREEEEREATQEDSLLPEDQDLVEVIHLNALLNDSGVSEGLVLTSDSESEIFCDSVDSVEQLGDITVPVVKSNGFQNGHVSLESSHFLEARQAGAGQGGEGGSDGKGQGPVRRRESGRDDSSHNWRERAVPQGGPRRGGPGGGGGGGGGGGAGRGGGGAGRGGGDGSEGGAERIHDTQLQQQIIVALRRLREDMRSVMERLEVVERLAATHVQGAEWGPCLQCAASHQQKEEGWWPWDVSGQTLLLFLLWPFVAQGVVHLMRKAQKRGGGGGVLPS